MTSTTLIVSSQQSWIYRDLAAAAAEHRPHINVIHDLGVDYPTIPDEGAVHWWIPAGHAARVIHSARTHTPQPEPPKFWTAAMLEHTVIPTNPLYGLPAPGPSWLPSIPRWMRHRTVGACQAVNSPDIPVDEAFVKLAEAKIDEFPAGWRSRDRLATDLAAANIPGDAWLQWSPTSLLGGIGNHMIVDEYRVFVNNGQVSNASPYQIPSTGATWEPHWDDGSEKPIGSAEPGNPWDHWFNIGGARQFAVEVVTELGDRQPPVYSLDVARVEIPGGVWQRGEYVWMVVEANPAWCSGTYGCDPVFVLDALTAPRLSLWGEVGWQWFADPSLMAAAERQPVLPVRTSVAEGIARSQEPTT